MRRSPLIPAFAFTVGVAALALFLTRCAGCSAECTGDHQGAEGCPCQSDQDCTTVGAILLCSDGACTPGDPPDAHGGAQCSADGDCADGTACGADGTCQPAPACQRLEPSQDLSTRTAAPPSPPVVSTATVSAASVDGAPRADCGVAITIANPARSTTGWLSRDGLLTADRCTGRWYAAWRAGFLACDGQVVALSAPDVHTCVGAECVTGSCQALGDGEMGVCP